MTEPVRTGGRSVAPLTIVVAVAVVIVDQLTKWWAVRTLDDRNIDVFWTLALLSAATIPLALILRRSKTGATAPVAH